MDSSETQSHYFTLYKFNNVYEIHQKHVLNIKIMVLKFEKNSWPYNEALKGLVDVQ